MTTFTKDELLKIAHLSALKLSDQEADVFVVQLGKVLDYITQIQQAPTPPSAALAPTLTNILRDDTVVPSHPQELLDLAPQAEGRFIVVPKILEEKSKDAA